MAGVEERKNLDLRPGDTVRVWQKIKEGDKTRSQAFEGLVLARKHGKESGGTFTVRKVIDGIGVEKIFPIDMPGLVSVKIVKQAAVRRSKLYYLRERTGKAAMQLPEKKLKIVKANENKQKRAKNSGKSGGKRRQKVSPKK